MKKSGYGFLELELSFGSSFTRFWGMSYFYQIFLLWSTLANFSRNPRIKVSRRSSFENTARKCETGVFLTWLEYLKMLPSLEMKSNLIDVQTALQGMFWYCYRFDRITTSRDRTEPWCQNWPKSRYFLGWGSGEIHDSELFEWFLLKCPSRVSERRVELRDSRGILCFSLAPLWPSVHAWLVVRALPLQQNVNCFRNMLYLNTQAIFTWDRRAVGEASRAVNNQTIRRYSIWFNFSYSQQY